MAPDALAVGSSQAGTIRVIVFDENRPGERARGVRVLFTPPGGSPASVLTDADGIAEASAAPGTDVTVIQPLVPAPNPGTGFVHFTALEPGDVVVAGPQRAAPQIAGTVTVRMPAEPDGMFYTVASSCPSQGAVVPGVPNVVRLYFETPCDTATSTTLVGRKHDAQNLVTGVSVLDGVDLLAAANSGATIMMPPYKVVATPIGVTVSNLPDDIASVSSWVVYTDGDEPWLLEMEAAGGMATDPAQIAMNGYPVGDQTTFGVNFYHDGLGGAASEYQAPAPAKTRNVAYDAADMIETIVEAAASRDEITWTTSPTGTPGTLVAASVSWGTIRGLIYAPYTGTSLSLHGLPAELYPNELPDLHGIEEFAAQGASYRDLVQKIDEGRNLGKAGGAGVGLPRQLPYWWTSYPPGFFGFSTEPVVVP